jgi:hypothetical protein
VNHDFTTQLQRKVIHMAARPALLLPVLFLKRGVWGEIFCNGGVNHDFTTQLQRKVIHMAARPALLLPVLFLKRGVWGEIFCNGG